MSAPLTLASITVRRRGRAVLDGIDAAFGAGRLTAVIGPNGAGKSTLLQVAAGLLRPAAGDVRLETDDVFTLPARDLARRRAYLPQQAMAEWPITVERVVALGLTPHLPALGRLPAHLTPAIEAALARHDLVHLRDRPATELSGGELARVMLARATVGMPAWLIVDEPTAGLDPRHMLETGRQLRALADRGCGVVAALHDLNLVATIADDVVALKQGKVVAAGLVAATLTGNTLRQLYDAPVRITHDGYGAAFRFVAD